MRIVKSQFRGQLVIDRRAPESLVDQLVGQLRGAIEAGRLARGTRLPSTRALARLLGVSRNTAFAAYEELVSCGLIRGRPRAGMFVAAAVRRISVTAVIREAQFPFQAISVRDPDGNAFYLSYQACEA